MHIDIPWMQHQTGLSSPLKWNPLVSEGHLNGVEHNFVFASLSFDTADNVLQIAPLTYRAFSNSTVLLRIDII